MSLNNYGKLFETWEVNLAIKLVKDFRNKWQCLEREFIDDLIDECLKHWFFAKDSYSADKEASLKTYMARVVTHKLYDLVKERQRIKRKDFFKSVSLNQFLEENSDSPFLADPSQKSQYDQTDHAELVSRIQKAYQQLTPNQKKLCEAIKDGQLTITQVSFQLKIHRSTVYEEIKRIREIFETEGLKKYLD